MKWSRNIKRDPNPSMNELEVSLENLDRSGVVMKYAEGGFYLDIDNDWVWNCVEIAERYGYEIPPFFEDAGGEGAHVKIAEEFEIKKKGKKAEEDVLGRKVDFEVKGAYASYPNPRTYGLENILKIHIESADLKQIREDLTGKKRPPNGKFFFIVGAVRKIKPKRNLGMKKDTPFPYPKDDENDDDVYKEDESIILNGSKWF